MNKFSQESLQLPHHSFAEVCPTLMPSSQVGRIWLDFRIYFVLLCVPWSGTICICILHKIIGNYVARLLAYGLLPGPIYRINKQLNSCLLRLMRYTQLLVDEKLRKWNPLLDDFSMFEFSFLFKICWSENFA